MATTTAPCMTKIISYHHCLYFEILMDH